MFGVGRNFVGHDGVASMNLECVSCAARSGQAEFDCPSRGPPFICRQCEAEAAVIPLRGIRGKPTTRASYRARLRSRRAKPQLDLVDLIVRAP